CYASPSRLAGAEVLMHLPRRFRALVFALAFGALLPQPARAQTLEELRSINQRVSELYRAGKYSEAVNLAEHYAELAKRGLGAEHPEYAEAITWLAFVYKAQGRLAEAEPLYRRALAVRETALQAGHPDIAQGLNNLAVLY